MRPFLFALVATLSLVGAAQVRADLVTYDITGIVSHATPGIPLAVGDKLTWTIQYDRSQAPTTTPFIFYNYQVNGSVLTNLVDQTTGYHLNYPQNPISSMQLERGFSLSNVGNFGITNLSSHNFTTFGLSSSGITLSSTLANLQLDHLPFDRGKPILDYYYNASTTADYLSPNDSSTIGVIAIATSINSRVTVTQTPEPSTLTLCILGALGLAGGGLRRRLVSAQSLSDKWSYPALR